MTRASRKVASPRVVCVEDLRPMARRRVPRAVFDYLDGGAEGEVTLRENCRAFEDVTFRPRHAVALAEWDLQMLGQGQEQFRARLGSPGLDEAEMPWGHADLMRELHLAATPPDSPVAYQRPC